MISAEPLPVVFVDRALFGRVFQNLIANAIKFRRDEVIQSIHISCADEGVTYGELYRDVRRFARGLWDRGFRKGDVLAVYCPNVLEYPVAFHGAASIGGIATTINPLYTPGELERQLKDANAKFLLTSSTFLANARESLARLADDARSGGEKPEIPARKEH